MSAPGPDGAPRLRAAVLGHPISHSQSPALHAAAYRELGLEIDYRAVDLVPEQVADFVDRVRSEAGPWLGCSVTMPLKAALVEHMDVLDERVRRLGVLNTVVWDPEARGAGHNTDVDGIVAAFGVAGVDLGAAGGTLAVLGGGGTASAAVEAAAVMGLDRVELLVRSPQKVQPLVTLAEGHGMEVGVQPLQDWARTVPGCRAVVATLPPRAADPLAAQLTGPDSGGPAALPPLLDVAYDPWPSALAQAWAARPGSGTVVSGLEMLLYQAVEQVRLFTARVLPPGADPDWTRITARMAQAVGLPPR